MRPPLRQAISKQEVALSVGSSLGAGACSAVVGTAGLALKNCSLAVGSRRLTVELSTPPVPGASLWMEHGALNTYGDGDLGSVLSVETQHPEPLGTLDGVLDRCCRQDATSCFQFSSAEACEASKRSLSCLGCSSFSSLAAGAQSSSSRLGCPEFQADNVPGYGMLREEVVCDQSASGISSGSSVASVSECAILCNLSTSPGSPCNGFSILPGGRCQLLLGSSCCPGTGVSMPGAVSYFVQGSCNSTERWEAAVTLSWLSSTGGGTYSAESQVVGGPGGRYLLPRATSGVGIANFAASLTPDLGLVRPGAMVTSLALFGQVSAPFDFGVPPGSQLSGDGLRPWSEQSTFNRTTATLVFTDVPGSLDCTWYRIGGPASSGANSVRCTAGSGSAGLLASRVHTLLLMLPTPSAGGFSAAWSLVVEVASARAVGFAMQQDALGVAPAGIKLQQLTSSVQVPGSKTIVQLAFVLGLWASELDVTLAVPELTLRSITSCGPSPGWPFPAASAVVITSEAMACNLRQVSTGEPSTEFRIRLDAENRGVLPGTKGVFTLSLRWSNRNELVSTQDYYSVEPPFGGFSGPKAGASLALSVRGSVGPLILYFPTSVTAAPQYAACQADMRLQISLVRDQLLAIRSSSAAPLSQQLDAANCGEALLETFGDGSEGFPAPTSCRWDKMTQAGDRIELTFGRSKGLPSLEAGRNYSLVFHAELLGLEPASDSPALGLGLLCGSQASQRSGVQCGFGVLYFGVESQCCEALESSELKLLGPWSKPGGAPLQLLASAPAVGARHRAFSQIGFRFEAPASSGAALQLVSPTEGRAGKLRLSMLPVFGPLAFSSSSDSAVSVSLQAWWSSGGLGGADASADLQAVSRSLATGFLPVLPWVSVEMALPAGWGTQLRALQASVKLASSGDQVSFATGFGAHPYVYLELLGTTDGDALLLGSSGPWLWATPPGLRAVRLLPSSQMGGNAQRIELFLTLGFATRGATFIIQAPAGVLIDGYGPSASSSLGVVSISPVRKSLPLPADSVGPQGAGGIQAVTLTVPSTVVLWQATSYAYSLYVRNPPVLASSLEWSVTVEFTRSLPAGGSASGVTLRVQKAVTSADGAFVVVPALEGCSLTPSSMKLGSENSVQVFFALPAQGFTADLSARPFTLRLLSPRAFRFDSPGFRPLRNLPLAAAGGMECSARDGNSCNVGTECGHAIGPQPTGAQLQVAVGTLELPNLSVAYILCRLGFSFQASKGYAFEADVVNPSMPTGGSEARGSEEDAGSARGPLRGVSVQDTTPRSTAYMDDADHVAEEIPRIPSSGVDLIGSRTGEPFPLYLEESQRRFFSVDFVGLGGLAALSSASSAAVTFQARAARPASTWLIITAPSG
ncbi:unnamed protein product, partial [Polarella glacialis]